MLNRYSKLSDNQIIEKYLKAKKMKDIYCFNSTKLRNQAQNDFCFLQAEIIKRNLKAPAIKP